MKSPLHSTRRPLNERWNDTAVFLRGFLRQPALVGAVLPSSRQLALAMVHGLDLARAATVVELGPGTGAITAVILDHLGPKTQFLTIELDHNHCAILRKRFAHLAVYQDSAERLPDYLRQHGAHCADYILSGLPWASLPLDLQDRLFTSIVHSLSPNGAFVTFAYLHARWLPKAVRFRNRLLDRFDQVELSKVVWRNAPPAFVYRCSKPRSH